MPMANTAAETVTEEVSVQLEATTGVPATMLAEQSTTAAAGQVIVGAAFAIVKTCVQLAMRLQASVTVYTTL